MRATAFLNLEELDECVNDVREALVLPAEHDNLASYLHLTYGSALLKQGKAADAEPFFSQSHRLEPDGVSALSGLWVSCAKQRKFASCLEVAKQMCESHPNDKDASWMFAASLAELGRFDDALADLDKSAARHEINEMLESVRGQIFVGKGKYRVGLGHFVSVFERQPRLVVNNLRAAFLVATCPQDDVRNGERGKAIASHCVDLLKGDADQWMAIVVLATAQAECGEFEEAKRTLTSAKRAGGENEHCLSACDALGKQFAKGNAYRHDPSDRERQLFEIPIGYYVGKFGFDVK